jgi:hypothetical protein
MNTETTVAENTAPEQEAPRKTGRPPPIVMTSTTNFIRLQSDVKDQVKGEYSFRNTRKGTHIITKETVEYSAMKSILEKNNLRYFNFSRNSEKPIKAVIRHLPPDTPAEGISNSLDATGCNISNVRQITATRTAPNGQTHMEPVPLFLVSLTGNVKSQEILKLNSLNHIIVKVEFSITCCKCFIRASLLVLFPKYN